MFLRVGRDRLLLGCQLLLQPGKKEKKVPSMQNTAIQATFIVFQVDIFSLLFKPRDCKFSYIGVSDRAVLIMYLVFRFCTILRSCELFYFLVWNVIYVKNRHNGGRL